MLALTASDIDRLERAALTQIDKPISTPVTIMPGELLALCAAARALTAPTLVPLQASAPESAAAGEVIPA